MHHRPGSQKEAGPPALPGPAGRRGCAWGRGAAASARRSGQPWADGTTAKHWRGGATAAAAAGRAPRRAPPPRRRWPVSRTTRPRAGAARRAGGCPDRGSSRRGFPSPCRRRRPPWLQSQAKLRLEFRWPRPPPAGTPPAGPGRTPTRCRASPRRYRYRRRFQRRYRPPRPRPGEGHPPRRCWTGRTGRAESATARPGRAAWRDCCRYRRYRYRHRHLCLRWLGDPCHRRRRRRYFLLIPPLDRSASARLERSSMG